MRCKIHPSNPSAGVCATCLRERLIALAAAVANASEADFSSERRRCLGRSSPSNTFGLLSSDPPLGCTASTNSDSGGGTRRHVWRFTVLSSFLGHSRHRKRESDSVARGSPRSRSWLSMMIRGRRKGNKKKTSPFVLEERVTARGMSPAEKQVAMDYESESGYHTEPSVDKRRHASSPIRRSEASHCGGHNYRRDCRFNGFALCFSPLMRPSPGNRRNPAQSEVGFSGELGGIFTAQRHMYGGYSAGGSSILGSNRSRKIADFDAEF